MNQLFLPSNTGVAYRPPLVNGTPPIWGTPEAKIAGSPGFQVTDVTTGTIYVKKSAEDLKTGWESQTSS